MATKNKKKNPVAKLLSEPRYRLKTTKTKKERENQMKFRNKQDPENDYNNLDDWLIGTHHG